MTVVLGPHGAAEPTRPPNFEPGVPAIMPKLLPVLPSAAKSAASAAASGAVTFATSFETWASETGWAFGDVVSEEQAARATTKIAAPIDVVNLKCDIGFRLLVGLGDFSSATGDGTCFAGVKTGPKKKNRPGLFCDNPDRPCNGLTNGSLKEANYSLLSLK